MCGASHTVELPVFSDGFVNSTLFLSVFLLQISDVHYTVKKHFKFASDSDDPESD